MSHEVEQMAYVGQTPWHGLGHNLPEGCSIETWQEAAGLNWEVSKRPVQFRADDGLGGIGNATFKDKFVLARDTDNRPFAVVSDRYKPVQPKQILEFFRDLIADFGMTIETAGSLRDGQRVWALAKTGKVHEVLGVDKVDSYLMLATSYDLTFSTLAQFTSVRVVCNNTLQQSFADHSARVTIPHFRDFNEGDVKAELGAGFQQWDKFAKSMDDLAILELDTVAAHEVLTRIFPLINDPTKDSVNKGHILKVTELFNGKAIGAEMAGRTGWGLVNAITEYLDQHRRARSQGNRLDSAWFGDGFITKQRAYDELMSLLVP